MTKLAMNPNGRWYRVSTTQGRYFPINRLDAIELLRSGKATEVPYLPWSRPDLYEAYKVVQQAISKVQP